MKKLVTLVVVFTLLVSCQTVRVSQDYALEANFTNYKTYAYFKAGIDDANISELDKKRILRAIDTEMAAKGFVKSDNPDMMVSIFTDSKERVDVFNNWGWGFGGGWGWGFGGGWGNNVSRVTEGVLYIDLIDARKKELIWQGVGTAPLKSTPEEKVERTNKIVKEILKQYPPMPQS